MFLLYIMKALLCTGDSIITGTFTWPTLGNGTEQEHHSHLYHQRLLKHNVKIQ